MSDRKAELEKKKAKLQAIREQKERLRKEKEKKDVRNLFNLIISSIEYGLIVVLIFNCYGKKKNNYITRYFCILILYYHYLIQNVACYRCYKYYQGS